MVSVFEGEQPPEISELLGTWTAQDISLTCSCPPTEAKPPDELPTNERVNQLIGTAPALTVSGDTLTLEGNGDRMTFMRA